MFRRSATAAGLEPMQTLVVLSRRPPTMDVPGGSMSSAARREASQKSNGGSAASIHEQKAITHYSAASDRGAEH